jgi:F-type H+-transporting ATPase subunit epsilon
MLNNTLALHKEFNAKASRDNKMATEFRLQVFTQQKAVFEGPVTSIIVPAEGGYLGVMANHAPLIAALGSGILTIKHEDAKQEMRLSGGFLEVAHNQAIILADSVSDATTMG